MSIADTLIPFGFGGLFTLAGGYLGSRVLIGNEEKRQRREFIGALQVARAELVRNATSIKARVDGQWRGRIVLSDHSFRSVESILARNLPIPLFAWLGTLNDQLMRYQLAMDDAHEAHSPFHSHDLDQLGLLGERLWIANRLVLRYLRERLSVIVPPVDVATLETAEQIEQNVEQLVFAKRGLFRRMKDRF
jgi:hypothetical protein